MTDKTRVVRRLNVGRGMAALAVALMLSVTVTATAGVAYAHPTATSAAGFASGRSVSSHLKAALAPGARDTIISGQTTHATPNMAVGGSTLYVGYTGDNSVSCARPCHNLYVTSSTNGSSFSNPVQLADTAQSGTGPGVCGFNGHVYLVWAGSDNPSHIYVGYFNPGSGNLSGHTQIADTTYKTPACVGFGSYLYIVWTGSDGLLRVRRSANGTTWNSGDRWVLTDSASSGPGAAVAYFSGTYYFYIEWAGTDNPHHINWAYFDASCSNKGACPLKNKQTDTGNWTNSDMAGAGYNGALWMTFAGTDLHPNFESYTPPFSSKSTDYGNFANAGIGLAAFAGHLYYAWGGTDSAGTLNVAEWQ